MKTQLLALCAIAVSGLTVSACSTTTPADLPPGKYEKTTTSTDAYGTETTRKSSTDVDYDSNGNKKAVVKSETSKDPKGLFNKSTSSSESTYEEGR